MYFLNSYSHTPVKCAAQQAVGTRPSEYYRFTFFILMLFLSAFHFSPSFFIPFFFFLFSFSVFLCIYRSDCYRYWVLWLLFNGNLIRAPYTSSLVSFRTVTSPPRRWTSRLRSSSCPRLYSDPPRPGSHSLSTRIRWSSVRVTRGFLLTSLAKARLPRLLSLAGREGLGRFLVVPNFFHLWMMVATVVFGTCEAADIFPYPSPDLCLDTILFLRSADNSFDPMAWSLLWHALSAVGPYIGRCWQSTIMSNQLNSSQVDSN